jgi:hypothetical protein
VQLVGRCGNAAQSRDCFKHPEIAALHACLLIRL